MYIFKEPPLVDVVIVEIPMHGNVKAFVPIIQVLRHQLPMRSSKLKPFNGVGCAKPDVVSGLDSHLDESRRDAICQVFFARQLVGLRVETQHELIVLSRGFGKRLIPGQRLG